ncbi:response regulator [Sphingomonas sp.]|uniref:response regulator n=1 Tax=Sphingomonas sp. TaxID=28214 RepID=UPI001B150EE9|nr:response regulator [Sphingomonas sp.]MBO9712798.1 response regulator [Sphingomonas sp.]
MLRAFWNGSYAPHGYCLFWDPGLIWTHILADLIIAGSYFSIPIALVILVRRRRDLAFGWVFWCFATFILACGLTHVMSIWTLYQGVYGLEALVKVVTAAASVATAVLLWPLLPKAIALPSAEKLQLANFELAALIRERDSALEALRAQVDRREQAEEALRQSQKLEAVGQLTGGIAHDFNNLLQAIAGNLELITGKPDQPGKIATWGANALKAVARGRALSGQLLAFSRRQKLDITSVNLAELIRGSRELIERSVAPLGKVRIETIDSSWNVEADPLQLELAVLNLAFNARDAMPDGGTLTITAQRRVGEVAPELPEGDYIALSIADTGTGMPPEVAARALEPFFTTKEVGRGTGMGLSMAFGVMRQSRGSLKIDTQPGRGTTITLLLRVSEAAPSLAAAGEAEAGPMVSLAGRTIAVIDDDDEVRAVMADVLRDAGAEVVEASDGAEGVAAAQARVPDLMIVDYAMPGLTGADVARQIRGFAPRLPILVVTGFADSAALDTIDAEIGVLRKPFESRELLRRVAEMLDG